MVARAIEVVLAVKRAEEDVLPRVVLASHWSKGAGESQISLFKQRHRKSKAVPILQPFEEKAWVHV